jgi:hypothetical protein
MTVIKEILTKGLSHGIWKMVYATDSCFFSSQSTRYTAGNLLVAGVTLPLGLNLQEHTDTKIKSK